MDLQKTNELLSAQKQLEMLHDFSIEELVVRFEMSTAQGGWWTVDV